MHPVFNKIYHSFWFVQGGVLAILTLPVDDRNRIEANLDTAFVNLKIPFPSQVDIIAKLKNMSTAASSMGSAPSYMDKINNIIKRKREDTDDQGKEEF